MDESKQDYALQADKPQLGRKGDTVSLTAWQVEYLERAGIIKAADQAKTPATSKGKRAKK
tara:strand:- start:77 stop:256 length:180 start_codon:yes stop_codon:yes gene_type:complete